jgi:hypothetical protein
VAKPLLVVALVFVSAAASGAGSAASRSGDRSGVRCGGPQLLTLALKQSSFRRFAGEPGRLLANRCATVRLDLHRQGRLVIHGSCFVHALQFAHYPWIEYRLNRTWLALPKGTWTVRDSLREAVGQGTGATVTQDRRTLAGPGRITVHGRLRATGGALRGSTPKHAHMSPRIACGVLAGARPVQSTVFMPAEKAFATIAWPSFKLLGINVPVDPRAPDGGLTP